MGRKTAKPAGPMRPMPPPGMGEGDDNPFLHLAPAPEVQAWVESQILNEDGALYNEEHKHLGQTDLRFLWASGGFSQKQRFVVGQAEQVMFRAGGWQKARQEQQMRDWFGYVPDFLITLDASYARSCTDTDWCALVEHELYHVAHLKNEYGAPAFLQDGRPKIGIQGHDVEEFVGVVRRYGIGNPHGMLSRLVKAAQSQPEVSRSSVGWACGTCHLKVA